MVRYIPGNHGCLIFHKVFPFILDTLLIAVVLAISRVWYVNDLEESNSAKDRDTVESNNDTCVLEKFPMT